MMFFTHFILIPNRVRAKLLELINFFQIDTYCRIDTRVCTNAILSLENVQNFTFEINDVFFLEINTMPTIEYSAAN